MIPPPPQLSDSIQPDAIRENFRRLNRWMEQIHVGGVEFAKVNQRPTTLAGYGVTLTSGDIPGGTTGKAVLASASASDIRTAIGITTTTIGGVTVYIPAS